MELISCFSALSQILATVCMLTHYSVHAYPLQCACFAYPLQCTCLPITVCMLTPYSVHAYPLQCAYLPRQLLVACSSSFSFHCACVKVWPELLFMYTTSPARHPNTVQRPMQTPKYCTETHGDTQILYTDSCRHPNTVQRPMQTPTYCT